VVKIQVNVIVLNLNGRMNFKQIPSTAIGLKSHIYTGCKIISFHHHSYMVYWTAICYNEIHHFVRHILGPLTVLWFWEIPDGMKYSLCNCHLYFYEKCIIFCMQWTENTALFTLFFFFGSCSMYRKGWRVQMSMPRKHLIWH